MCVTILTWKGKHHVTNCKGYETGYRSSFAGSNQSNNNPRFNCTSVSRSWQCRLPEGDFFCTIASFQWSFGVTCWEVFALGSMPYAGVDPFAVSRYLLEGERLEKSMNAACSDQVSVISFILAQCLGYFSNILSFVSGMAFF